jgi:iron complex outermembrane receptor protein
MATRSTRTLRALLCGASLSLIALASPALAAPADADQPTAEAGEDEIVVTATRRAENIKDVPSPSPRSAARSWRAQFQRASTSASCRRARRACRSESSFGRTFPRFYIRGLGNTDFDPNAAQPVSVVYDDVALESAMLKSFPVFDLAGRSAARAAGHFVRPQHPAGVIKLDSAKPSDSFGGYGSASWGTYNTVNAEAALTGPLRLRPQLPRLGPASASRRLGDQHPPPASPTRSWKAIAISPAASSSAIPAAISTRCSIPHPRSRHGTPRVFRAGLFKQGSNRFSPAFDPRRLPSTAIPARDDAEGRQCLRLDYHSTASARSTPPPPMRRRSRAPAISTVARPTASPALGLGTSPLFPSNTGGHHQAAEFSQEFRFASDDMNGFRFQGGRLLFPPEARLCTSICL